jgi:hypothetical protein
MLNALAPPRLSTGVSPLRAMNRILALVCALSLSGCTYWPSGTYFKHGISQYRGEGSIRDVSQRSGLVSGRGYVVQLEHFDLGSAYEKQFQVANLPTIVNSRVEICLAVEGEEISRLSIASFDTLRRRLVAELTISLTDSAGVTVTQLSTNVGTMWWSSPVHGYSGHWLYDQKGSFFTPRPEETYSLRVRYSPDAALRGKHGCIYLYSGCGGS